MRSIWLHSSILLYINAEKKITLQSSSNKFFLPSTIALMCVFVWICETNNKILLQHAQFASVVDGRKINHHVMECVFYVTFGWHGHHCVLRVCVYTAQRNSFCLLFLECIKCIWQTHLSASHRHSFAAVTFEPSTDIYTACVCRIKSQHVNMRMMVRVQNIFHSRFLFQFFFSFCFSLGA